MAASSQLELLKATDYDDSQLPSNYYVKYKQVPDEPDQQLETVKTRHPQTPQKSGQCFPLWFYKRNCVLSAGILSVAAVIVTTSIFIHFAVSALHPHVHVVNFVHGTCIVDSGNYTEFGGKCGCSQSKVSTSCKLTYPCLEVIVRYQTEAGETHHTQLYASDDEFTYTSHCSITPHCVSGSDNKAEVEAFRVKYGERGQTFPCFHHSTGYGAVVTRLRAPLRIFHILLWPGIAALLSFLSCLFVFLHCVPKFCNKEF